MCEAVLLESLSQRRTFSGRQSHVYSYQLADPGTRSGFFETFHTLYKQRLIDVRAACVARPGHEVVSMDVKRFYPSVPRKQLFNEFLHACRSESLDPVALRVAEFFLGHFEGLSVDGPLSIPTGPALSHVLGNFAFKEIDTRLLEEFPGGYFRYVDDLVIVCQKRQAGAAIAKIEEAIRPFALNAEKSDTLTSEHWVERCPWRAEQTVQEGSWEAFVASLKWFTALYQDKVGKLSDAFRQEGFNLPLAEYEFHARAADFGGKLRLWWHRNWKVLWRTARHTPESLVEEAVRLREQVRAKLDRLMDQNLPHSATLRKWRLQELKYYLGRSLYLEPFSGYERLAQASEGVPELHETWSVAHAVATSDATAVVHASGRAASALARLLRASGQRLSLAVGNLGWGEAEIQALAVLELYGVEVKFGASGAPSAAVERDPSRRLARGQEPLPGTHSFFDYVGELSALTGGRTADKHRRILFSRYSADENLAFDALALDRISGDEPGLGDLEPLGHH